MGRKAIAAVAGLVRDSKSLETLALYLNGIDHQGAIMLSDSLMCNTSVTHLDVGANPLGSHGVFSLALALERNTTLRTLDIRGCELAYNINVAPPGLPETIPTTRTYQKKKESRVGIEKLCSTLSAKKSAITTLLLSFNQLDDRHIQNLCNAVVKNPHLLHLALVNCQISPRGMGYITRMVQESKLEGLELGLNAIERKAAKNLSHAIKANRSLTYIDLTQCRLGGGVCAIAEALAHNTTLKRISLGGNLLEKQHLSTLAKYLNRNNTVEELGQLVCRCESCRARQLDTLKKLQWKMPKAVKGTATAIDDDNKTNTTQNANTTPTPKLNRGLNHERKGKKGAKNISEDDKKGGWCLERILRRNILQRRRRCASTFLLGLRKRAGSGSAMLRTMGSSNILDRGVLGEILELANLRGEF
ncbi:hypothetical protein AAMO2058_000526400 [Amorphochlora amoebiformis]